MTTDTMNDGITGMTSNENGVLLNRDAARVIASLLEEYGDLLEDEAAETCDEGDVMKAELVFSIASRIKTVCSTTN